MQNLSPAVTKCQCGKSHMPVSPLDENKPLKISNTNLRIISGKAKQCQVALMFSVRRFKVHACERATIDGSKPPPPHTPTPECNTSRPKTVNIETQAIRTNAICLSQLFYFSTVIKCSPLHIPYPTEGLNSWTELENKLQASCLSIKPKQ